MARVLGLDVGTHRIGVAVSDESGTIASPLESVPAGAAFMERLGEICREQNVHKVVVGLPLTLSGGDRNDSTVRAKRLGKIVGNRLGLEVVYFDERFTTTQAERVLIDAGVRRKGRREVVDKMAASLILQAYLDQAANRLENEV